MPAWTMPAATWWLLQSTLGPELVESAHCVWLPLRPAQARAFFSMESGTWVEYFGHEWWCMCHACEAEYAHHLHQSLDASFSDAMDWCPGVLNKQ